MPEPDVGPLFDSPLACPKCGGDGIDASHDAALYYAHRGELTPCPTCDGTGKVPTHDPFDSGCVIIGEG